MVKKLLDILYQENVVKKTIRFLVHSLAPVAVLITYIKLLSWASVYARTNYEMLPLMVATVIGYALIGIAILFICKNALAKSDSTRIPFEFLIGILFVIISNLYFIVPELPLPEIFAFVPGVGLPITGLFIGIYISLFVILTYRRTKALKAQKADQSATSSDKASE